MLQLHRIYASVVYWHLAGMTQTVTLPLWLLIFILAFASVTFASHFLFPSVRWYFRRRMERVVARINTRLSRPIEPFKLARRYDTIQRLVYDPEVARAVDARARELGHPQQVVQQDARRYAREIVPAFSATAYFGIATRVSKWLSEALYDVRLVEFDEGAHAQIPDDATVVYVMNHRSNMDYLLITYLAARRSALSYAIGEWARVFPIGRLFRAMGGYFIRRKSRNALYRKVLSRYVQIASESGLTQAVFPEGGLSLDGRIAPPKLGILSYIVEAAQAPEGREIVFVPVALNYDRVLEDRVLVRAHAANERRFGVRLRVIGLFLWRLMRRRWKDPSYRFGYAAVSIGAPVFLTPLIAADNRQTTADVARNLMERIASSVPVLPVPLVAHVLCEAPGPLRAEMVAKAVSDLVAQMACRGATLPFGDALSAASHGLETLNVRKVIEEEAGVYVVAEGQHALLAYYARSIAHLLSDEK